jgi:hypothetical protein
MTRRAILQVFLLSPCLLVALSPCHVRADGGALRLHQRAGNYRIAVFTSPTPFRAGMVDVSVLVQDALTGECVPAMRTTVVLTARDSGLVVEQNATAEAATNKLFHAAVFQLPEPGWWDGEIRIDGLHGPVSVHFAVAADEPLPPWRDRWPWFTWPAIVVAIFVLHQGLVRRRRQRFVGASQPGRHPL